MTCQCGAYANATVNGINGGRVPVCDDCITAEPGARYRIPNHPHVGAKYAHTKSVKPEPETVLTTTPGSSDAADVTWSAVGGELNVTHVAVAGRVFRVAPVVLQLPEPPSANRWWRRHGTVMHISREAKAYKQMVAERAGTTGWPNALFVDEPLTVVMVWHRDRKAGDLDKRLGVLLDALQGNVYENDSQVVQIWARRCDEHPEIPKGHVRVEVSAL